MGLELKNRALMKLNFKLFTDMIMLREGAFTNVSSGSLFYDGSVQTLLLPDANAPAELGLQVGQVYQSAFREWVYESGVNLDGTNVTEGPLVASGVFVQGAFREPGDAQFGHTIDYTNGRIIFNDPHTDIGDVHAGFAYRHVRVSFEHQFNQQFKDGYTESKYATNPETSMQLVYPSGRAQPFPAVFIEIDTRTKQAYELGNRSAMLTDGIKFHIWALDDLQRDNIVDIIDSQWHKRLPVVDFNRVPLPLSGLFNTLSPEYIPYQTLLANNVTVTTVGSGNSVRYIADIEESEPRNVGATGEYERAIVEQEVMLTLNAPTTPIPHVFAPIRVIPPDIDPPV